MTGKKKDTKEKTETQDAKAAAPPVPSLALAVEQTVDVSLDTLEATPEKALQLLRGIGKYRTIRSTLAQFGYTAFEHARGWELLQRASGFRREDAAPSEDERGVEEATTTLTAWKSRGFTTFSAVLKHRYPQQERFLFNNLGADKKGSAVVAVQLLLDRIDELETGTSRPDTQAADRAAVATLGERGLPAEERQRLRRLVTTARAFYAADNHIEELDLHEEQKHLQSLRELRAWYEEWSTIAHANITRREDLIHLGLAQRKKSKAAPPPPEEPKK